MSMIAILAVAGGGAGNTKPIGKVYQQEVKLDRIRPPTTVVQKEWADVSQDLHNMEICLLIYRECILMNQ